MDSTDQGPTPLLGKRLPRIRAQLRRSTDEDMAKVEALLERAAIATEGKPEAEYRRHPAYREARYLLLGR